MCFTVEHVHVTDGSPCVRDASDSSTVDDLQLRRFNAVVRVVTRRGL